jgi:redox-sensitive bicupin YhaK (pirin superfamily)
MILRRPASERGRSNLGWLDSRFTFSFSDYYDEEWMGFHSLRVINDDRIAPAGGFPMHPHRDMEILTVILEGELEHKDSMGTGSVIRVGDVQKMSAGTGVLHSEFNPSKQKGTHLLQVWIVPDKRGVKPNYDQRAFPDAVRRGKLCLLASGRREDGVIHVEQDMALYGSHLTKGETVTFEPKPGRAAWLHVASGSLTLNGETLGEGDGAGIEGESRLTIATPDRAEFLLFDLA